MDLFIFLGDLRKNKHLNSVKIIKHDQQLIQALKTGSEQAFTEIYNLYWKKLLGLSIRYLRDQTLAEGVVQEVFISLWNKKELLQIDSLERYLATAVKYSTFKAIHKNNRHIEVESHVPVHEYYVEDEQIDARFLKDYLDSVVNTLPEKCKIVFKLSRDSQLSNHEISSSLNISEKTVEAHITRALKVLRFNLQKVGLSLLAFLFF